MSLGNNTGMERVVEFGDRLWYNSVYTKFVRFYNLMMKIMSKALIDEFIIEVADHSNGYLVKKLLFTRMVLLVIFTTWRLV